MGELWVSAVAREPKARAQQPGFGCGALRKKNREAHILRSRPYHSHHGKLVPQWTPRPCENLEQPGSLAVALGQDC